MDRSDVIADARAVLARHARTFNLAGRFLGRARRDEAAVVYAFCRLVDDLADESPSPEIADRALAEVEAELRGTAPRARSSPCSATCWPSTAPTSASRSS
jgi:phytoene synthase